jgi:hypothetical protein
MPAADRSGLNWNTAGKVCHMTTATVAGLYLATHSVTVTVIGTCSATALTAWAAWLSESSSQSDSGLRSSECCSSSPAATPNTTRRAPLEPRLRRPWRNGRCRPVREPEPAICTPEPPFSRVA